MDQERRRVLGREALNKDRSLVEANVDMDGAMSRAEAYLKEYQRAMHLKLLSKRLKIGMKSIHETHEELLVRIRGEELVEVNSESDASDHRGEQCEIDLEN